MMDFFRDAARFRHRQEGVAAVEFALVLPFMMILLVGVMDMGLAMIDYRTTVQAGESLAKTSAQLSIRGLTSSSVLGKKAGQAGNTSGEDAILNNGLKIVLGSSSSTANVCSQRLVKDVNGQIAIVWAWPSGCGASHAIDTGSYQNLMAQGDSVLVADVKKKHDFIFSMFDGIELGIRYTATVPSY